MCEVWKWIIIGDAVPLVIVRLLGTFPFAWGEGRRQWLLKVRRYLGLWWLGVFVLVFASVVYAAHCNP